jgi:NADP-dependent alcohol dehydrogenase
MQNFEYYNPTRILFGAGEIARLQDLVKVSKVLLLYGGGSIKSNGVYEQVKQALQGKEVFEVSGVQPNPTYEKAMEAVEVIRKEQVEFILAVGGGSVIDSAKFIALATHYHGNSWDIFTKQDIELTQAVPFGVVLTLPATGSEMNSFFVISKDEEKLAFGSPLVFPQFSILDPSVTFSLDQKQLGNGVVDAFVHVMEQYLTFPVNAPLQDRFAEAVLLTLIEEGPKSYRTKDNYEARSNHMWASTMALSGVLGVGVPHDWSTHTIGHELTALYGLDHARTLAVIFPAMMWVMKEEKKAKIVQYAERIWKLKGTEEEIITTANRKTADFFQSLGLPTKLSAYGIKEDVIARVTARLANRGIETLGEKGELTLQKVQEVLRVALQ